MEIRNINIDKGETLNTPNKLKEDYPVSSDDLKLVLDKRKEIRDILNGKSNKLIIVIGPCSIHSEKVALEYAQFMVKMNTLYGDKLCLIMRTYLSKPRTCMGWKGYLYQPDITQEPNLNKGLELSRKLLLNITRLGVTCSMEYLDTISPQYFDDLLVWGAIGARTSESQVHRELVSGLSTPVGFKNSISGEITNVVNSIKCSKQKHTFLGCNGNGEISSITSRGNNDCHLILRGSDKGPNYKKLEVLKAVLELEDKNVNKSIIIDCSHGNSGKDYKKQKGVALEILETIKSGVGEIKGIMIESNLKEGNQKISEELVYGQSITDSCINLIESEEIIKIYHASI